MYVVQIYSAAVSMGAWGGAAVDDLGGSGKYSKENQKREGLHVNSSYMGGLIWPWQKVDIKLAQLYDKGKSIEVI